MSAIPRSAILKSLGAIIAGFLTTVATSTAVDLLLHQTGIYPPVGDRMPDGLFVLAFAYRAVFAIAGCWVAARLAPNRPMGHALVLGALGTAAGVAGVMVMGDLGPLWYSVGIAVTALPFAWIGGKLAQTQFTTPAAGPA